MLRGSRGPRLAGAAAAAALALACAREGAGGATRAPLPGRLSETGLFADVATRTVAADALPFAPQYPLWTDGAEKRRWLRLPPGTAIDGSDPDAWEFPVGTRLWKEFTFGGRPIETRLLERGADGAWRYATYVWTEDGADALLAPPEGVRGVCTTLGPARHDVPSVDDCLACHAGAPSPVLGVSALQLSPDRDPLAPGAEVPPPGAVDLPALVARGLLVGLPAELVARPPRIDAPSPRARAALGYLHANCGSCHAEDGALSLDMALAYAVAPASTGPPAALRTTVGRASRARPPGAGDAPVRVAPGAPERSVLALRMATASPLHRMPPLGTHVVHEEALELVAGWIREDLAAGDPDPASPNPDAATLAAIRR